MGPQPRQGSGLAAMIQVVDGVIDQLVMLTKSPPGVDGAGPPLLELECLCAKAKMLAGLAGALAETCRGQRLTAHDRGHADGLPGRDSRPA